jgi:hypothetical protein
MHGLFMFVVGGELLQQTLFVFFKVLFSFHDSTPAWLLGWNDLHWAERFADRSYSEANWRSVIAYDPPIS